MRFLIGAFLNLFIMLAFLSCGQKSAVKEETEEAVSIETNEIFSTEDMVEISNKLKVLILPFVDRSDAVKYPNAESVNGILMNELYTFLYIVPSFDVPEKTNLAVMNSGFLYRNSDPNEIYSNYQADVVIYGDYSLQGAKSGPQAQIHLNIWRKAAGKTAVYNYKTPIDADIFDAVDAMLAQIIHTTLNEDIKIAYLNFGNFKIGNGSYALIINNKAAAKITNDNFSMNLKIVPNAIYTVKLKNLSDNEIVLNTPVAVKQGESTNINHTALGSVKFTLHNKFLNDGYRVFMDGKEVYLDNISKIPAGREHEVKVVDDESNEVTNSFYLSDGEFTNLILTKKKIVLANFAHDDKTPVNIDRNGTGLIVILTNMNNVEGRNCRTAEFTVGGSEWAHIYLNFGDEKMEWTDMNAFKIWIFGTQTLKSYFIQLVDKWGEDYWYWTTDNWKGWKQLSIPLSSFQFRKRNYPSSVRINYKKDYPLRAVEIEMNSWEYGSSSGNFKLIFSDMEVTRE